MEVKKHILKKNYYLGNILLLSGDVLYISSRLDSAVQLHIQKVWREDRKFLGHIYNTDLIKLELEPPLK